MTNYQLEINKAVEKLISKFQTSPESFFAECDFQYYLFYLLNNDKFNTSATSKDGRKVTLVHPEYPSVDRVQLSKGKGYRVWYDLAVLNPEFIKNNDYRTVLARDERYAKPWGKNILAVFEIKYFPRKGKNQIDLVREDCLKLSLCPEAQDKYILIFAGYDLDIDDIALHWSESSHLYWITKDNVRRRRVK